MSIQFFPHGFFEILWYNKLEEGSHMFELRVTLVALLCVPLLVACVMLISKLVDEFIKNKNR